MPRIKIIDRYLAWEYLKTFLAILGIGVTVLLLNVFFDSFEKITENQPPLRVILLYFAYRLPGETVELVPLMAILGVLFSIGVLSKNNEVLAMHACGVSYTRLSLPVAMAGVALTAILMYSSESVLPRLKQRERFYENVIDSKDLLALYRQVGDAAMSSPEAEKLIGGSQGNVFKPETHGMVYFAEFYDSRSNTMAMPVVFEMDPSGRWPTKRIQATLARLVEGRPDADVWRFDNVTVVNYDPATHAVRRTYTFDKLVRTLPKHLDQLLAQRKSAGEMNIRDLA
ncbi:MAG: LptF/LptG family permease, partial [Candidatus Sumerlaeota bacterium]|nr:LptF/LptG family permease [Candidatus Sumerlaeota bacterium]